LPNPALFKISGPKYMTVLIPQNCCQNCNPAPTIKHIPYAVNNYLILTLRGFFVSILIFSTSLSSSFFFCSTCWGI